MPNPFDIGSARILSDFGFHALATTSGGLAASLGRRDMTVDRDTTIAHVRALVDATHLPVNVDAERCFGDSPEAVAETVAMLAEAGAAGCSIEDWDPDNQRIDDLDVSVERVRAAVNAASESGLVLTARCESVLRGVGDLDTVIFRLLAYRDAGAEVLYAPGLIDPSQIERLVREVTVPVNVLLMPQGPRVSELAELGVRRVSTGNRLASVAYGALRAASSALYEEGHIPSELPVLDRDFAQRVFA